MGELFLVPTPIGNLGDMTYRAVATLKEVDLILAEDTRTSGKLLNHYQISTPMQAFHMHNEHRKLGEVGAKLSSGMQIALISDAGTPGISDPGFLLVREALSLDIKVSCLPGPTAMIPALVQSGMACDRFVFEGFLPPKKGRNKRLEKLRDENRSLIFYESPHKLLKTLTQFSEIFGPERGVSVSRELSKMFEETFRGTLNEALNHFNAQLPKGEFVICVAGSQKK
ncbi:MAG: 16S rRNA (cytidine(1402)-2'-O)-methyltransferase [Flavobacteriaceae bacterium]|jgi:16S rRNA (cytidine1402-2'-O)-methyltransferase|nr:16S rRNA (cytidine(1402)-2'-O)-methyltransferase [Flavobacteriaceae bacterium]MBT6127102.1 16S rRNA (cytidine(1402)-2'-O)-methyltransferase [Flavobacteriaceae bacterium]